MRWITRERPKIDRIACPWLIKNFIDTEAEFIYVPFDEVASKLKAIQAQHGKDAVGIYQGNPSVHNSGTLLSAPAFLRALGTKNRFSATSADQLPHHFVQQ